MIEQVYRNTLLPTFDRLVKRRHTFSDWRELERSQWWTPMQIQSWQLKHLRLLLNHCVASSSYYRELWANRGLQPEAIRSLEDFTRWPVTTRETMRQQKLRICNSDPGLRFVSKSTGGSSGVPLQLVIDHRANDRRTAAAYRGYAWAGAGPGTKQSHLWGVSLQDASMFRRWKERLYHRGLFRRDMMNCFELSEATIASFVSRLNRYRPQSIVAYTNPLYELARAIDRRGLAIHHPHSILVGAEKIYGFQRELIEKVFDAPVFETYGSREFTLIGAECEHHRGLHVTSELLIVEIVDDDGQRVAPGQEGDIVITDLFNGAMPFVRYAIGDRGIAATEACPCGRGLPLLKEVVGRQLDVVVTPDGRRLAGEFFPHLFKDIPSIRQFQVVQTQPDALAIELVVDDSWTDVNRKWLKQKIGQSVGPQMKTTIQEVDAIPLTAAGKRRVVIGHASERDAVRARRA